MTESRSDAYWQQRWHSVFAECPPHPVAEAYRRLRGRYAEASRAYHTFEHIQACLGHLDRHTSQLEDPRAVELALWYHDVIYNPRASDNEAQSARYAANELTTLGEPAATVERVSALILTTQHPSVPRDNDEALLLDIDLAILGAPPEVYQNYEAQIREEYRWVPGPLYRRGRKKLLRSFLENPPVYHTSFFQADRERQARRNLAMAIDQL